jgi:hypothetical protein
LGQENEVVSAYFIITGSFLSLPQNILPHSNRFHFFRYRNNIYLFTEQGRQPCIQPRTWRARSLYLCPPVTGWSTYIPRHRVPFLSFSHDSQGYGGGILTRLHSRNCLLYIKSRHRRDTLYKTLKQAWCCLRTGITTTENAISTQVYISAAIYRTQQQALWDWRQWGLLPSSCNDHSTIFM